MTILDTRAEPRPILQAASDDIDHEVCCIDDDTTMCGLIIPGEVDEEGGPNCLVCLDLLERWAHYADLYGEDPQKPGDAPCRLCPKLQRGESK